MYDKIKCATGWTAIFAAFGYAVWALIATSDGPGGVMIPVEVSVPVMTGIILLTLTSIVMRVGQWVADHVVNSLISDHFDLLVNAVVAKLEGHHQQLQQTVKAEVAAALQEVSNVAFRAAVVRQASDAAAGDATVTQIPSGRR